MVKHQQSLFGLLFIAFLLILYKPALAKAYTPKLFLFVDKTESVLGRPIRAEFYAISLNKEITDINLTPLHKDFGVIVDYAINNTQDRRWPNQEIQILKLKLYPKTIGDLTIPSLNLDKTESKNQVTHIAKGNTGIPEIFRSSDAPYQRQQTIFTVSIKSSESSSRLLIKDELKIKNVNSTRLKFQRVRNTDGTYTLKTGWAISSIRSGKIKLDFPPIEYSVSGVSRKQFYLPTYSINIKALPAYLPATIPIGKIKLKSEMLAKGLLATNTLSYWNITLEGDLNNAYQLPAVLRQIKPTKDLDILPVNSKRNKRITENSLTTSVTHSIPFKALSSGILKLPRIRYQYFDPTTNKIISVTYQEKTYYALSIYLKLFFAILSVFISSYFIHYSYKKYQRYQYSKLKREQAIVMLKKKNYNELRHSLHYLAESEYWNRNLTITQWASLWKKKYKVDKDFDGLTNELSRILYSKEASGSERPFSQLINLILNRKQL